MKPDEPAYVISFVQVLTLTISIKIQLIKKRKKRTKYATGSGTISQ